MTNMVVGNEGVKPGWTRICFPYYMSTQELEFALTAIEFVATYGHLFLAVYNFNWHNGDWTFRDTTFEFEETRDRNRKEINSTSNKLDLSKLAASLLQNLRLTRTNNRPKRKDAKVEDRTSAKYKYASYLETALYVASLLPKSPIQRSIPQDLVIDLPFKI